MPSPPLPSRSPAPFVVLAVGVAAVSTGSIFVRMAEAPALTVAFWRCALAALLLLAAGARPLARALVELRHTDLLWILAAGALLALHFATWISSLGLTTVAASVLLVNTGPVWAALLTRPMTGERVRPGVGAGIALCLVGCVWISAADLSADRAALAGNLLALAGGLAASLYLLAGRRLRGRVPLLPYLTLCYGAAALSLLPICLLSEAAFVRHPAATYGWLVALALVPQLIGHSASNWAVRRVSAAMVTLSLAGEPLLATLLAWWIFAELPAGSMAIGGPLVLLGILLAARAERLPAAAD